MLILSVHPMQRLMYHHYYYQQRRCQIELSQNSALFLPLMVRNVLVLGESRSMWNNGRQVLLLRSHHHWTMLQRRSIVLLDAGMKCVVLRAD